MTETMLMEIHEKIEGLKEEQAKRETLASSALAIRESFTKYLTWIAIGILALWIWTVDAKHPPVKLLEKVGRIEGKIDAVVEQLHLEPIKEPEK